jgi:hypothetical protein
MPRTQRGLRSRRVWPAGLRNQLSTGDYSYAEARTGSSTLPLNCAIDGGTNDAEQVGELSGAVVPDVEESHQMCFLPVAQLGLLAAQPPFGPGDQHGLPGTQANQVGLDYVDRSGLSRVGRGPQTWLWLCGGQGSATILWMSCPLVFHRDDLIENLGRTAEK